ncbi:uncharacterized protein LOC122852077 [Aphidius gifuensis]|uniref:uncharacterized protein LOC122852077 n=1 Tax=Aphidius gifuensis TaxID=684658 RepID=UPI001CDC5926|nr:uncharacterized protein LOC122852077 [Aphidius gifuensis]
MDKEKCNSESSTNQVPEKNDIDDKLSEPVVESISLQVSNNESKSVELLNKSDSPDDSLPKQLSSDKMIPAYAEPGSSKSFDIKEKKFLANAGKLSTNVDERKRSSEIANDSPLKKSSTRPLTENNYALENIRKISPPTFDDLMSASTSVDSPSSPDLSRSNDSANYYSNLLQQCLLEYQNNMLKESAKEFRECLGLFVPKTHQFMYVKTNIIPLLIGRHQEIKPTELTSQYAKDLENIIYNLIDDKYQTVRQCITDINKLFMHIYLQQFQDDPSNSWLNEIKITQQYFHELVANINWESREEPNESKYHPISKLTGSGKMTSQFTYLLDVLQSLQEHEYGYLLKQENNNDMTEIAGTSSSDVSTITVITLEIIRDRLLNTLYDSVEQCIQDIDELFIDSYIFKLMGSDYIPMTHVLYVFFREQIIDMPVGF